jgi:hypothetical protein
MARDRARWPTILRKPRSASSPPAAGQPDNGAVLAAFDPVAADVSPIPPPLRQTPTTTAPFIISRAGFGKSFITPVGKLIFYRRALLLLAEGPKHMPDVLISGPDSGLDETIRLRFSGEGVTAAAEP